MARKYRTGKEVDGIREELNESQAKRDIYRKVINNEVCMKTLIINSNKEDALATIARVTNENPGMTVEEYLDKYKREVMILV